MADNNWVVVQPSLERIMKPVMTVIGAVDTVLSFIIAVLNIVQAILSVIKVFLVGLLDPIKPIIEAIIEEIRNIINDLRQLGVYMASDKNLFKAPFSDLVGGYAAYERRMLARLLDATDPNRPNFSTSSAVLALFAYVSAEDAVLLIKLIFQIIAFFGDKDPVYTRLYPPPTTPRILFGPTGTFNFKNLSSALSASSVPDSISITWEMPTSGGFFTSAPKGFLIHVSTTPDGYGVLAYSPNSTGTMKISDLPKNFLVGINPADGAPLKLYGGASDLGTGDRARNYSEFQKTTPQSIRLFLTQGQNSPPFDPDLMIRDTDVPHGAATYFVKTGWIPSMGPGQTFTAYLPKSSLPKKITPVFDGAEVNLEVEETDTFYIRVRALTKTYVSNIGIDSAPPGSPELIKDSSLHPFNVSIDSVRASLSDKYLVPTPPSTEVSFQDFTEPSSPAVVTFPSSSLKDYVYVVQTAVLVAILCRIDLIEQPVDDEGNPYFAKGTYVTGRATGLEGVTNILSRFGVNPSTFYNESDPFTFRKKLLRITQGITNLLMASPPSQGVMDLVVESASDLINFNWKDLSPDYPDYGIFGSVYDTETSSGIAANPRGAGVDTTGVMGAGVLNLSRDNTFPRMPNTTGYFIMGQGSADYSPIIYAINGDLGSPNYGTFLKVDFVRKVLLDYNDGAVLMSAQSVLQISGARISRPAGDSQWITKRFLSQGLAPLDRILSELEKFLLGILDAVQGLIDKIVAYIDALQARIYQLQALIEQIRALLNSLKYFELPSFSGLVLVENGTSGIVQGLVSAGNKPSDSSSTYGAGAVFVFGGVPLLLLETLALAFAGGGEE